MRKERVKAATDIAALLFKVEGTIDAALQSVSALTAAIPRVRQEANLAATVGQDAIMEVAAAVAAMAEARRHVVTAHNALAITKYQIGLGELSLEGIQGKESLQSNMLRIVHTDDSDS